MFWVTRSSMGYLLMPTLKSTKRPITLIESYLLKWMRREGKAPITTMIKWSLGHRCKNSKVYIPQEVELCDEEVSIPVVQNMVMIDSSLSPKFVKEMEVSIHVISRSFSNNSMRLSGKMGSFSTDFLVNSGNTHNFLNLLVAAIIKLSISKKTTMKVNVANGQKSESKGMGQQLINIQGAKFLIPFHILSLGGCDTVLGVQ